MKTIGLIGGMSWESSLEYYRLINERVKEKCGGLHSAQSLMFSFDFQEIETLQAQGDWETATQRMIEAAQQLERGGADFVIICTGTMHKMAPAVQSAIDIPLLHIADATAQAIQDAGISTIGLLGTRFTMEEDFFKNRLAAHGLSVVVPEEDDRHLIHQVIYDELCLGDIRQNSRNAFQAIIMRLSDAGAGGVILGCTEIGLLIQPKDSIIPTFDITQIHAAAAVDYALASSNDIKIFLPESNR